MKKLLFIPFLIASLVSCNVANTIEYHTVDKIKIVSNNVSDYQLVKPDSKNEYINMAVNEFATVIEMASKATFKIVDESVDAFDSTLPYVSFGKTSLSVSNNITMPSNQDYLNSGYYLFGKGENIFVLSDENYDQEGILYGTYRLLEILVDYKAYSDDEIYVKESDDVYIPAIDESFIPSFDERELGYKELITNKTLASRLRLFTKETDNR